ncbi:mitochondrial 2-enoyl thioester reductase [Coemansia sp. RSA 2336]|nr:mitochondrial 2-enoyl thioester reductase [Coemansia sp. RSA 2336]
MRYPVSNFNRDMFADNPGFRSVHAHTLPGRSRDIHEWMGWTWPRFYNAPLLENPEHRPTHYHATRPSIFNQIFEPLENDPAEIVKHSDKWIVKLRNPAFKNNSGVKVQVRGGKLVVCAQSSRESPRAFEGNSFEYTTVLPRGFKASKITAKHKGDTMEITIPIVRVVECNLPDVPGSNQALVRMLAAPVNPSDLNQIEGTYPVKGTFEKLATSSGEMHAAVGGNEGVGEIIRVGDGVRGLQVGDWVVPQRAGQFGTWCTHTMATASSLSAVPAEWRAGLDPLDVACLKVNPCTAYRLLKDFAALNLGDYVIQNGANSGVGRAVIQLARQWGIRTINVVRERPQLDQLRQELSLLGADIVVSDKQLATDDVKQQLKSLDAPVLLGFNCVGGRATLQMTKFISAGGTLVSYGGMSRQPVTMPTSLLLFKDISACGFWMNRWYNRSFASSQLENEKHQMWREILGLIQQKKFVTQPLVTSSWHGRMDIGTAQEAVSRAVTWGAGSKHAFKFTQ